VTVPSATRNQLEPFLGQLLAKAEGEDAPLLLVRADPTSVPPLAAVAGRPVTVRGSASPLEIRALAAEPRDRPLVVVTSCDHDDLGADLVARAFRRRVHPVDRWLTVCELFGAHQPSRSLAQRPHLADALIENRPPQGYPAVPSRVLDLDTALGALLRAYLGVAEDPASLAELLAWAELPAAAALVRQARTDVLDDLTQFLVDRFGPGARAVLAAVRAGKGAEAMPIALAGGVVHAPEVDLPASVVHLDYELGRPGLEPQAYRDLATAAVDRVRNGPGNDPALVGIWLSRADELVDRWSAADEAWRSVVLPRGFDQRIARAARQLTAWQANPSSADLAQAAHVAIDEVSRHRHATTNRHRVDRLRMAARLIRRANLDLEPAGTLHELVRSYVRDGAWLDRARVVVSRSDSDPALAALCETLTTAADDARSRQGAAVATVAAGAAHTPAGGLLGVEQVLERVVAPVASICPVLVVVLDGMGWPTFSEVLEPLAALGWTPYTDPAGVASGYALAALPTVTEVSRTSLLAGRLRTGDMGSERRAFADHPALVAMSRRGHPPGLWHKADLRAGGLDTLPAELLAAIADEANRVVGVVLNNIDERLKDVNQPPAGWGLDELAPLSDLLAQARVTGRAVILTADHGHLLERGSEHRSGSGGERWRRPGSGPPGDGEIAVSGPRVVVEGGSAILAFAEQLRYAPLRNGYHGGLTPAELIVPVAVLVTDDLPGWEPTAYPPPPWWHHTPARAPQPAPLQRAAGKKRAAPLTPSLFGEEPAHAPPEPAAPWLAEILEAAPVAAGLARSRLSQHDVRRLLHALDRAGGFMSEGRLADEAALPSNRIGGYIAQLQRLVNLDGYAVVETREGEVRFDRELLERQLGLR
jgi:hypothetical protein